MKLAAARVMPIPGEMPFDEASAFILTYGTSYYALKDRGLLKAGETVLMLGAAGGVGVAAIELAKAMGARVIGAVSSEEKAAFAKQCGADGTVIYPPGAFAKEQSKALSESFKPATGGGADVIYDAVGGDYCEPALRAMNWGGRYLVIGFPAGIPTPPLNLTLLKSSSIVGVFWGASTAREPELHKANVRDLFKLYGEGKIKPRISERYTARRWREGDPRIDGSHGDRQARRGDGLRPSEWRVANREQGCRFGVDFFHWRRRRRCCLRPARRKRCSIRQRSIQGLCPIASVSRCADRGRASF